MIFRTNNLALEAPDDWIELATSIPGGRGLFSLAKGDTGVGALQASVAVYQTGVVPDPSMNDLIQLVEDFALQRGLVGLGDARTALRGSNSVASASFRSGPDFVRIWYVSNGRDIAKVTYVCAWEHRPGEVIECETIVDTIKLG